MANIGPLGHAYACIIPLGAESLVGTSVPPAAPLTAGRMPPAKRPVDSDSSNVILFSMLRWPSFFRDLSLRFTLSRSIVRTLRWARLANASNQLYAAGRRFVQTLNVNGLAMTDGAMRPGTVYNGTHRS